MSTATPAARSSDGRRFRLAGGDAGPPPWATPGSLVVVSPDDGAGALLAQVVDPDGSGLLVGLLGTPPRKREGIRPFPDAPVRPATVDEIATMQQASGADLPVGTWALAEGHATALLRSQGFGRHTFLCGQSGSGKTYALGVILEQVLLHTELRMVVLDPNADFVRLGEVSPDAPEDVARHMSSLDVRILAAQAGVPDRAGPLRLRFSTMPRAAQAALMQLSPLADREEYNVFLEVFARRPPTGLADVAERLRSIGAEGSALRQRVENLGLMEWDVWAGEDASLAEVVAGGARATVADLSGFHDPREPRAVALDLVESLWRDRTSRTPTLLVIDEAHNLCPAQPRGPVEEALVERLVQIAAEGRKYGLWLFLSTQRPSKIHPQVLSQCDNLVLMRMNSPGDVAELDSVFGFAPPTLTELAPYFVQGEALVAGTFVPRPAVIRMGSRFTPEGGADVPVPMA